MAIVEYLSTEDHGNPNENMEANNVLDASLAA
jgi:hypothetical protein